MAAGKITLKWDYQSEVGETYLLYLSTSPTDPEDMPDPFATIGDLNVKEFVFDDLTPTLTYYMRIGVTYKGEQILSEEISRVANPFHFSGPYEWLEDSVYASLDLTDSRMAEDNNTWVEVDEPLDVKKFMGLPAGGRRWSGATLADNGYIYCAHSGGSQILKFDPSKNSFILFESIAYHSMESFSSVICAQNGKLYFIPSYFSKVLVVDPNNGDAQYLIDTDLTEGSTKWKGATLYPDGKIYCAPYNSSDMLIIDTNNDTVELLSGFGEGEWTGACIAPNGNIFFSPRNSQDGILEFNVSSRTKTFHTTVFGASGIVPSPDGTLYLIPYSLTAYGTDAIKFDTQNPYVVNIVWPGRGYAGGVMATSGEVILGPRGNIGDIEGYVVIDSGSATVIPVDDKLSGGMVLHYNGNAYSLPGQSKYTVHEINTQGGPYTWALSRYFNKSF